jgi:hypothetical protein
MEKNDLIAGIIAGFVVLIVGACAIIWTLIELAVRVALKVIPWVCLAVIVIWVLRTINYIPW